MNTNKRNISILGAVIVVNCLFFSCVKNKAEDSIVIDLSRESGVMDIARD